MKKIHIIVLMYITILESTLIQSSGQDIYDNTPNVIIFESADEFKAPEVLGQYYKDSATATISNPRQSNYTVIFVFEKVIEEHGNIPDDDDLTYIGSYTPDKDAVTMHLYGILRDPLWN